MEVQKVVSIETVIDFIENHLDGKLELDTVAASVHYSKYHLHRMFTETVWLCAVIVNFGVYQILKNEYYSTCRTTAKKKSRRAAALFPCLIRLRRL